MFIRAPSIHKGNSSGLCKALTSGSKALSVLETAPRNLTGTPWLLWGGVRVTAGMQCRETRREMFHLYFAVTLATASVSGQAPGASPAEARPDFAPTRAKAKQCHLKHRCGILRLPSQEPREVQRAAREIPLASPVSGP